MPTIGWFEILIVVAVAIIVIGPKDFPYVKKSRIMDWYILKDILAIFKMK